MAWTTSVRRPHPLRCAARLPQRSAVRGRGSGSYPRNRATSGYEQFPLPPPSLSLSSPRPSIITLVSTLLILYSVDIHVLLSPVSVSACRNALPPLHHTTASGVHHSTPHTPTKPISVIIIILQRVDHAVSLLSPRLPPSPPSLLTQRHHRDRHDLPSS